MIRISRTHIADSVAFVGLAAVLCVVVFDIPTDIAVGEMAWQKLWLGRMSMLFAFCMLFSLCLNGKRYLSFHTMVTWILITLGGIEAVWGLRQIYGLAASNHSLFALTGSFFNPGPYSGYLAMIVPLCLHEWLQLRKKTERTWIEQGQYYVALSVLLLILCVLPAGMSRSAWMAVAISGVWVYGMHASWGTWLKEIGRKYKKRMIAGIVMGGIILIMTGYALFQLKAASANGRLFMWKVSCEAIAESPVVGHGVNNFTTAYGRAQENYFKSESYSPTEEWVAGSPEYAFNEYLQVIIEYGVPFLLVILWVVAFSLWRGITEKRLGVCGGVISVLIFAFSSYPMQIPGFAMTFYFLLAACAIGRSKILLSLFTVMVVLLGAYYWKNNQYDACNEWSRTKLMYNIGAYGLAKEGYEKLHADLWNRGAFLFEYGHCLHKLKEYDRSTRILEEAMEHSSDPMVLNIIGKNYQALGEYEKAEASLIRSTHRLPGRIYPYYLLAKLYTEPEYRHVGKFKQAAEMVLTKEPKVQSTAVREMREEINKLIVDYNEPNSNLKKGGEMK